MEEAGIKRFSVKCKNDEFETVKQQYAKIFQGRGYDKQSEEMSNAYIQIEYFGGDFKVHMSPISRFANEYLDTTVSMLRTKYEWLFQGTCIQWHQIIYAEFNNGAESILKHIEYGKCNEIVLTDQSRHVLCVKGDSFTMELNKGSSTNAFDLEGAVKGGELEIKKARVVQGNTRALYQFFYSSTENFKVLDSAIVNGEMNGAAFETKAKYYDWKINPNN